jgi:hypothetical protein
MDLGTAVPLAEDEYIELLAIRTERHLRHLRSVGGEAVTWPGEFRTGAVGEPARGIAPEHEDPAPGREVDRGGVRRYDRPEG